MNDVTSTAVLAAGAVVSIATIYCYRNGYTLKTVLDKFEENKDYFHNLVENLIKLGRELLEKLVSLIQGIVKDLRFKFKLTTDDILN